MKNLKRAVILCLTGLLLSCPVYSPDAYRYGDPLGSWNHVHVFLIGIDGWGSFSMPKADMPKVKEMINAGAYTFNTMNVLPAGSMPNWASMIYGTTPAFHGFTHNTDRPVFPPAVTDEYGYYPGIFALIKRKIPACHIAVIPEYKQLLKVIPPQALDTAKEFSGCQDVIDHIDRLVTLAVDTSFTFVHFDKADGAGHGDGFNTSAYYAALHRIDEEIRMIIEKAEVVLTNPVFVLSADHGGIFKILNPDYSGIFFQHGGNTPEERQIPLVFYSKAGIKQNFGISGQVNIYDIAPTIAAIFGIPQHQQPEAWLGRRLEEIFP